MKLEAHGREVHIDWSDERDHIPRRITETEDFYERALLDDAYDRAPPGLVVDAGAHIGNHTLFFAGVMDRFVVAFEPNPAVYVDLLRNVARNGLRSLVDCHRAALGARDGAGSLRTTADNSGATKVAYGSGPVRVLALDSLDIDVAVLKIDVEGQAMAVLTGARVTLERCRPLIYVETQDDERIDEMLLSLGYRHRGWMGATPTHVWQAA